MRKPLLAVFFEAAWWYVMAAAAGAFAAAHHDLPADGLPEVALLIHRAASLVALLSVVLDFSVIPED